MMPRSSASPRTSRATRPLPCQLRYRIVDEHGAVSDLNPPKYETAAQRRSRAALLERAQDHIFWRRVLYHMFVFVTLALVFMPTTGRRSRARSPRARSRPCCRSCSAGFRRFCRDLWLVGRPLDRRLDPVVSLVPGPGRHLRPAAVAQRLDHRQHLAPQRTRPAARQGTRWRPAAIPRVGYFEQLAKRLRSSRPLRAFHRLSTKRAVPILAIVFGLYVVLGAAYRFAVYLPGVGDGVCRSGSKPRRCPMRCPFGIRSWSKEFRSSYAESPASIPG